MMECNTQKTFHFFNAIDLRIMDINYIVNLDVSIFFFNLQSQ
jgi:hypothetical protein